MRQIIICFLLSLLFVLCVAPQSNAQSLEEHESTLAELSVQLVNDSLLENRKAAFANLMTEFEAAFKLDSAYSFPFDSVVGVSRLYAPDSTFRMLTWQLFENKETYTYSGCIVFPDGRFVKLTDASPMFMNPKQQEGKPELWFGALYYNMTKAQHGDKTYYLLFGFDGHSYFNKQKLIEAMHIAEDGTISFGAPIFKYTRGKKEKKRTFVESRFILNYSAEVSISLNWSDLYEVILFDHLILAGGSYGQGPAYVTDGSYEAFQITGEGLFFIEKYFNQISLEPPMDPDAKPNTNFAPPKKKKKKRKKKNQ